MDWTVWSLFALTDVTLSLTPGPAVLFVVSQGLRLRSARALWSAVGILAANVLFFAISGTGVGTLLASSATLFTALKWSGAAYLLYMGTSALLRPPPSARASGTPESSDSGRATLFVQGFIVQLSNPKALLFFAAILPQFIDQSGPIVFQLVILGVTSIVLEFMVLAAYGTAAARAGRVTMEPRFVPLTARLSGGLMVGAALGLARLKP